MTNQEAYNLGLTDAENIVIDTFKKLIRNEETTPFNNPELDKIRQALTPYVKHIYGLASKETSNVGKYVLKSVITPSLLTIE